MWTENNKNAKYRKTWRCIESTLRKDTEKKARKVSDWNLSSGRPENTWRRSVLEEAERIDEKSGRRPWEVRGFGVGRLLREE